MVRVQHGVTFTHDESVAIAGEVWLNEYVKNVYEITDVDGITSRHSVWTGSVVDGVKLINEWNSSMVDGFDVRMCSQTIRRTARGLFRDKKRDLGEDM